MLVNTAPSTVTTMPPSSAIFARRSAWRCFCSKTVTTPVRGSTLTASTAAGSRMCTRASKSSVRNMFIKSVARSRSRSPVKRSTHEIGLGSVARSLLGSSASPSASSVASVVDKLKLSVVVLSRVAVELVDGTTTVEVVSGVVWGATRVLVVAAAAVVEAVEADRTTVEVVGLVCVLGVSMEASVVGGKVEGASCVPDHVRDTVVVVVVVEDMVAVVMVEVDCGGLGGFGKEGAWPALDWLLFPPPFPFLDAVEEAAALVVAVIGGAVDVVDRPGVVSASVCPCCVVVLESGFGAVGVVDERFVICTLATEAMDAVVALAPALELETIGWEVWVLVVAGAAVVAEAVEIVTAVVAVEVAEPTNDVAAVVVLVVLTVVTVVLVVGVVVVVVVRVVVLVVEVLVVVVVGASILLGQEIGEKQRQRFWPCTPRPWQFVTVSGLVMRIPFKKRGMASLRG
jgi:hypothetical protein